jgi:two-component system copper resistance phosphate regulon response regulator CusR
MHILLIEDEIKTAQFLKLGLEEKGFEVDVATDGIIGRAMFNENAHDLVITDLVLPGMDGKSICRSIREAGSNIPVLMLTALGSTEDVVSGLESGADDYLIKPFAFDELVARVRTLIRRHKRPAENILTAADLVFDIESKKVSRAGISINLTAKEMELLKFFMLNRNKVLSKSDLARNVWKIDFETGTNMVEVYVNYLRKKIDIDFSPKLIVTHFGKGYEMKDPDQGLL